LRRIEGGDWKTRGGGGGNWRDSEGIALNRRILECQRKRGRLVRTPSNRGDEKSKGQRGAAYRAPIKF